jgi:hypothetical protein
MSGRTWPTSVLGVCGCENVFYRLLLGSDPLKFLSAFSYPTLKRMKCGMIFFPTFAIICDN